MPALIEKPILDSPHAVPTRYYRFDEDGITDEVADGRRPSSYFIPIASPKKKTRQLTFDTEWTADRAKENDDINFIRSRVALWRDQGYADITPVTRSLLEYWTRPDRERKLFFCQIEALETLIFLAEAAEKAGEGGMLERLKQAAEDAGTPLFRLGCKMATGSGKTVVMAMLIAWAFCNRGKNPQTKEFPNAVFVCCPNLTVKERLQVLRPENPKNYYVEFDIVPPNYRPLIQ